MVVDINSKRRKGGIMFISIKKHNDIVCSMGHLNFKIQAERKELMQLVKEYQEQIKTLTEENTRLKTLNHNKLIDYMVEQYTCKEIHTTTKEYKSHEVEVVE